MLLTINVLAYSLYDLSLFVALNHKKCKQYWLLMSNLRLFYVSLTVKFLLVCSFANWHLVLGP